MANYSTLKTAVQNVVKTNGTKAITGANLQSVLLSIINSVGGGGYIFKGVATPSTNAGTPDENVFYIGGAGTYANFGTSVTVPVGSIGVFKYNGSWTKETITMFAGIDDVPTAGSDNPVKSGGVYNVTNSLEQKIGPSQFQLTSNDVTTGYYRMADGNTTALAGYFISNPIRVYSGTVFTADNVSSFTGQSSVSILVEVDSDNNYISRLIRGRSAGTYTYTFQTSCYVSCSGHNNDLSKMSFSFSERITELENEVARLDAVDSVNLPVLSQTPIERIRYDCGLFSIFTSIGIIGDSYASGEMQGYHSDGTGYNVDMYEFSWGQQMAKMTGADVFNFSQGGQSARGWMKGNTARTWDKNDIAGGAHSNKKGCYFIDFGRNDKVLVENNTYTAGIGTVADINVTDYTLNADSFVGWYAQIIQALKQLDNRCFIFCITTANKNLYADYNAQVRNIVQFFTGQRVFLIDLETYAGVPNSQPWYFLRQHPSAAGYLFIAYEIMNYVDWIIRNNGATFIDTALVGTDIYYPSPV